MTSEASGAERLKLKRDLSAEEWDRHPARAGMHSE